MISLSPFKQNGFTLIEILMTMALVAILSVGGISLMTGSIDENRYDATVQEMKQIRAALVGDSSALQGGARSSFGYAGDMGALPSSLNHLLTIPPGGQSFSTSGRFGHGWNGPYLQAGAGGKSPVVDAWLRPYLWVVNAAGDATLSSLGADGIVGGTVYDQDILVQIPAATYQATVFGFVSNGGGPFTGAAQVELNFASSDGQGRLQQSLVNIPAGSQGEFQLNSIPMGVRSLSIFVPTKAAPTKTLGPLLFTVDKPKFLAPVSLTDVNPGGGGGGAGAAAGTCATNSGFITLRNGSRDSSGSRIDFRINASQDLTVTSVKAVVPGGALVNEVRLNSTRYRCVGGRRLSPCPTGSENMTLAPNFTLRNGSRDVEVLFTSSVNSIDSISVVFTHSGGCDSLEVTGLN